MLAVVVGGAGCSDSDNGDNDSGLSGLFPNDNEAGTWVEDREAKDYSDNVNQAGPEIETEPAVISAMINGDAAKFTMRNPQLFGVEYYKTAGGTQKLRMDIWQFANADVCKELYDALPNESAEHNFTNWETLTRGDHSRIVKRDSDWLIDACKGLFFIEITHLEPKDDATRALGLVMLDAVLAKLN